MTILNTIFYLIKRGHPTPTNFDYAVPLNIDISPQRFLCSMKQIQKVEIIYPIRAVGAAPTMNIFGEGKKLEKEVPFEVKQVNPSLTIFAAELDLILDGKFLEFNISRDAAIAFHPKQDA